MLFLCNASSIAHNKEERLRETGKGGSYHSLTQRMREGSGVNYNDTKKHRLLNYSLPIFYESNVWSLNAHCTLYILPLFLVFFPLFLTSLSPLFSPLPSLQETNPCVAVLSLPLSNPDQAFFLYKFGFSQILTKL